MPYRGERNLSLNLTVASQSIALRLKERRKKKDSEVGTVLTGDLPALRRERDREKKIKARRKKRLLV